MAEVQALRDQIRKAEARATTLHWPGPDRRLVPASMRSGVSQNDRHL